MLGAKQIKWEAVDKLIPYAKNARTHSDEQVAQIAGSIKEFGFNNPILVDKDNSVIAGHGRLMAARKLGMDKVPVVELQHLTESQRKAYVLADNRIALNSGWDTSMLSLELQDLKDDIDLFLLGFDPDELDALLNPIEETEGLTDEDAVPDVPDEPKTKLGDIYILGNHRLMCGDSTSIDDAEKLMDGLLADLVFTDPPYKIQTKGGTKSDVSKALQKQGNAIEFIADFNPTDFLNTLPIFFNSTMNAYVFCNKELLPDYLVWARDAGYSFNVLVWKKPNAIPIGDSHRPDIEYLLLFRKNAIWNNGLSSIVNYSRLIESPRETGLHPTMKPVGIITNQLLISSHDGSLVVDTFLGSGSTLIAAEKTGRVCYGMELDPKYVDVIIKRWEDYTGKTATKHG